MAAVLALDIGTLNTALVAHRVDHEPVTAAIRAAGNGRGLIAVFDPYGAHKTSSSWPLKRRAGAQIPAFDAGSSWMVKRVVHSASIAAASPGFLPSPR